MAARRKLPAGSLAVGFPASRDEAVLNAGGCRADSVLWDFAVEGGAISTISLGRFIPAGAVIIKVLTDELTAVTGATDVVIKVGSTALTGSIDFTGSAGIQNQALAGAVAGIKIASESEIKITIATAAATAGKVRIFVQYLLPTD